MNFDDYARAEGVNKSTLWALHRSPLHYKHTVEHGREDTQALRFGRLVHMAILTPSRYAREVAVAPDVDRRTKAGREAWDRFEVENAGRIVIRAEEQAQALQMRRAVRRCAEAMDLLRHTSREVALFWDDEATGLRCKGMLDAVARDRIIDLKTAEDAETDAFTRETLRRGYDVQAAHYCAGHRARYGTEADFYFVVVEKKPPFAVNVLHVDPFLLEYGEDRRRALLEKLKACRQNDSWPGYGRNEMLAPAYLAG